MREIRTLRSVGIGGGWQLGNWLSYLDAGLMTKRTQICYTLLMRIYNWNSDKNQELLIVRNVSFEEVIFHIEHGDLLDDIVHPNASDYSNQRIFIVRIKEYVHLVPYVENEDEIFLKTIIPSRKFTKLYLGG